MASVRSVCLSSGSRAVSVWAAARRGIPDVPHAANIVTAKCTEGSGVGFNTEPPVLSEDSIANFLAVSPVPLIAYRHAHTSVCVFHSEA